MLALVLFVISGVSGQIIKKTMVPPAPGTCSAIRVSSCGDRVRAMFMKIRDTHMYARIGTLTVRDVYPEGLDLSYHACMRSQLYDLRNSLLISDCVLRELLKLNQSVDVVQFQNFVQIGRICRFDPLKSTGCQLHAWYSRVFDASVGKPLESVGVIAKTVELRLRSNRISQMLVWSPPEAITRNVIDVKFSRLVQAELEERVELLSKRRMPSDEWLDTLIANMEADAGSMLADTDFIHPHGVIASPPEMCLIPRPCSCADTYLAGLVAIKAGSSGDHIPEFREIGPQLGLKSNEDQYSCVYASIRRLRKSLFIEDHTLRNFLQINQRNLFISSDAFIKMRKDQTGRSSKFCSDHIWFYHVINPAAGKTVGSMRLTRVTGSTGNPATYFPSAGVVREMIDLEIRRVRAATEKAQPLS
jgi:hypothetical protein